MTYIFEIIAENVYNYMYFKVQMGNVIWTVGWIYGEYPNDNERVKTDIFPFVSIFV